MTPQTIKKEFIFEIPKNAVKKKAKICIVCGFDPRLKEKSMGCYHWHKKISNRHQYIYYDY
jgi:ribosomal protein L37E